MYTFEYLLDQFEDKIERLDLGKEPKSLYEPIRYLLEAGGKRIRPVMALMASNMFTEDISEVYDAAIAIELFHNFTLLHDDIMDNASIRRGRPSVNKKWSDNVAILSGDTMSIMSYEYLSRVPQQHLSRVLVVFNKFAKEICEGQRYDIDYENREEVSKSEYIEMIRLKTSVLLASAMEIGAILGGADQDSICKLYEFGEKLGLAFQLSDDMLDTYGDSKAFGKDIGGDITEGKKTFLYISTLLNAPQESKKEIIALFENKELQRSEKIDQVKKCYDKYNAKSTLESEIAVFYKQSLEILDSVQLPQEKKEPFYKFAKLLIDRIK